MHFCKGIDKKGVLLHEYSQSAILHGPHFQWVVKLGEAVSHEVTVGDKYIHCNWEPHGLTPLIEVAGQPAPTTAPVEMSLFLLKMPFSPINLSKNLGKPYIFT